MKRHTSHSFTRRHILATGLGAALMPAGLAGAFVSGDETIKVALIGCGSRGTGAACQALATKGPIKLWAMADVFPERLEASLKNLTSGEKANYDREPHTGFGSKIDVPPERRFTGFDAYRQAIQSGVDLVILATPPHFRPMHYAYAVEQGKHVFMEKPVAVDAGGIREILAANAEAKRKNLRVGVGFMYRHNLRFQQTIQRVHDGAIGPITMIRAYCNTGVYRDTPPRPPEQPEMVYQLQNPYHFLWLSGDYFVDNLLHFIDLCNWAKGEHPVEAQGQGGRSLHHPLQSGDTFDHHAVEFTYPDGARLFTQIRQANGCWFHAASYVHGQNGMADIQHSRIEGKQPWRFHGTMPNPYQVEHDVLVEAIRKGTPHNEVDYGASSTMTAILGRMASYSGQVLRWDDAIKSNIRLAPERYALDAKPPVVADATGRYPVPVPGVTKVL